MKNMHPPSLPPTATRFVEYLLANGPSKARDLMAVFGKSLEQTTMHLRIARNLGFVLAARQGGHGPLWFAVEHKDLAAEVEASLKAESLSRRKERNRGYQQDSRERKPIAHAKDNDPPVQIVVPAAKAEKPQIMGPISVFHLGAML